MKISWKGLNGLDLAHLSLGQLHQGSVYAATSDTFGVESTFTYFANPHDFQGTTITARDAFLGSGFTYSSGDAWPTGGTITGYVHYEQGRPAGFFQGLAIAAAAANAAAQTPGITDDRALIRQALAGNDEISGSSTFDTLYGFAGKDKITGGLGADELFGGTGSDRFIFKSVKESNESDAMFPNKTEGSDTIHDFSHRQHDMIDVRKIDADVTRGGNQAFTFIGTEAFHHSAGELRYEKVHRGLMVTGDINGDGTSDLIIFVHGVSFLDKGDFVL